MKNKWIVVTTINPPTEAIKSISNLANDGWSAVVVGDHKTPLDWKAPNIDFLSVENQKAVFDDFAEVIPYNHYSRKNLGYLYAISKGAECILETDDDNIPYDSFGQDTNEKIPARMVNNSEWVNIYRYFTGEHIWPRGLPLDEIHSIGQISDQPIIRDFPIQQYLADSDPDVDAIYRLSINKEVVFDQNPCVGLEEGSWTPFNSQNTLFHKQAFPLLYLPCHVSFRMTDIWRSFVAQQALWVLGQRIAFLPATVRQVRNQHDLLKDFAEEIPGYLENKRIINILTRRAENLSPNMDLSIILRSLWEGLNAEGIIPDVEMTIIDAWINNLNMAGKG